MTYHPGSGPDGDPPSGPFTAPATPAGPSASSAAPLPAELAEAAGTLFGDRLPIAEAYAELLATDGVLRGLIGPRETARIWARHLLNCAPLSELIPEGSSVLDVGSGAGLPGIVLAIARPDLSIVLVEPLARRTAFLIEAIASLGLGQSVSVLRARAEQLVGPPDRGNRATRGRPGGGGGPGNGDRHAHGGIDGPTVTDGTLLPADLELADLALPADIVTARAVAPLDRLAAWCLPLTAQGGRMLALKGATAADEVTEHADAVDRLGGARPVVRHCGVGVVDPPTTVVEIVRERVVGAPPLSSRPSSSRTGESRAARSRRGSKPTGRGRPRSA